MSYIGSTPTTQSFIAGTDYFNGTGSAVNFTLSRAVNSVNDIEVLVNNVEQIPSGYSVSGTTLTFSAAPSAGTSNVYVRYLSTTNLSLAIPSGTSAAFNTVTATSLTATTLAATNISYTGTLTGNGGIINIGSGQVYKDASGNVGIGIVPSAWSSGRKAIELGSVGNAWHAGSGGNTQVDLVAGAYYNAGWKYAATNTGAISRFSMNDLQYGQVEWYNAAQGTAGNAVTWTQAMTLDSSGNLLVGTTTSPGFGTKNFELNAGAGGGAYIVVTGSSNTVRGEVAIDGGAMYIGTKTNHQIIFRTNDGTKMTIAASSGVITSQPTYNNVSGGSPNMFVQTDGTFYRGTSALKYKQDIRDLESIDIGIFRPVRYKSKCESDDQTKDYIGLIADEVAAAGITELVHYGADGEVEGFQYERLTVVLLKAIQEQQSIITALTTRITALENK
jgi:hypothetical protein